MAGKAENADYAGKLKEYLGLRYEPVAIKLVKKGEAFPGNFSEPEKQMSHCQAVFGAKNGMCLKMPLSMQMCNVGAASLGMMDTPGGTGFNNRATSTGISRLRIPVTI